MTEVIKRRKVAVECDTMLWDGSWQSAVNIMNWMARHGNSGGSWIQDSSEATPRLTVRTLEGSVSTGPGSLIVKGVDDEFWPVADGIWQRTYEDVPTKKKGWFKWRW